MKKRVFFFGIAAFVAIITLTFSLLACGDDSEGSSGPSIPKISAPTPGSITTDISGATAPTITNQEQAVEFLTAAFSEKMPNMDAFESVMYSIMEDLGLGDILGGGNEESKEPDNPKEPWDPIENFRATQPQKISQKIDINFNKYQDDFRDTGITLAGTVKGSFTMNSTETALSASGNINADCSLNFDVSKNPDIQTDDILVMDLKLKANGNLSMLMQTTVTGTGDDKEEKTTGNVSYSAGAAVTLAMAYKNGETGEGAKIILTAGYASADSINLANPNPDMSKISGNATLTIYDASNALIFSASVNLEDVMGLISSGTDEKDPPEVDISKE